MAKSKSFFGLRRGSTKSHTYQISAFGEQVTKDRVVEVKNPRTRGQMENRMIMATVSASYSAMRTIVDHSFEGVTYGAATMAKFVQANIGAIRVGMPDGEFNFGFNPYRDRQLRPGAYIVSKGSLPDVPVFPVSASSSESVGIGIRAVDSAIHFIVKNGMNVLTANMVMGLFNAKVGDYLTSVFIGKKAAGGYGFGYVRMHFKAAGTTNLSAANLSDFFEFEGNTPFTVAFDASTGISIAIGSQYVPDVREAGDDAFVRAAYGFILSHNADGSWLRSNATLAIEGWNTALPEGWDDALATYPLGKEYILNGGD